MTKNLAVTKKKAELVERKQVVMARNPEELNIAQTAMIGWANSRIATTCEEIKDLETNYAHVKKNGWESKPWKMRLNREKRRLTYYLKVKAALKQGYCIIPNFPIDVFAVKTKRKNPSKATRSTTWSSGPGMPDIESDQSAIGEGEYRSPQTLNDTWTEKLEDKEGKERTHHFAQASELAPPDFPFKMVKPQILEDASFAKTVKIFDELGVMPERRHRTGGDPVLIGRIMMSNQFGTRQMSFLISWWMNPEEF